jgi:hypothetical protein
MLRLPSHGIRKKAKRRGVTYSFLAYFSPTWTAVSADRGLRFR